MLFLINFEEIKILKYTTKNEQFKCLKTILFLIQLVNIIVLLYH